MPRRTCLGPIWPGKGADRRMSSNDVSPPEEPLLESAQEQEGTDASVTAQATLSTLEATVQEAPDAPKATAGPASGDQIVSSDPSTVVVNFEEICEIGKRYIKSPGAGRDWLKGFEPLSPGTDVSLRFVSTQYAEPHFYDEMLARHPSLLPLLSLWLESWFDLSKAARNDAKRRGTKSSGAGFQQDKDVEWLETYISDYLTLPNAGYEDRDIIKLAENVFNICRKSNLVSHVEGAINILFGILSSHRCPSKILESLLETLCCARAVPAPDPERAADCLRLVMKGSRTHSRNSASRTSETTTDPESLRNKGVSILLSFLRKEFGKDDKMPVNTARGAILTFSEMICLEHISDLEFDKIMEGMHVASEKHIVRLDTELLKFCSSLLQDEAAIRETLGRDWTTFSMVLQSLAEPVRQYLTSDAASSIQASEEASIHGMNKNIERLRMINILLEKVWHRLEDQQQRLLYNYLMQSPKFLSAEQAMLVIQYMQDTGLLWPEKRDWEQSMTALIDTFLKDNQQPTTCRIKVIDVISEPVRSADFLPLRRNPEDMPSSGEAFSAKVLQTLQDLIAIETDDAVMAVMVDKVADLITIRSLERPHAKSVIKSLQAVALDSTRKSQHIILAVQKLVAIFMRAVYFPSRRPKLAFKALVQVAGLRCTNVEARLAAMKLLFRIRCDSAGFIYVQYASESEYIAAALCRTSSSAEAFGSGQISGEQRNSASSTSLSSQSKTNQPMWMYPGPDPLPETAQSKASMAILARGHQPQTKTDLEMALWLESVVSCLQKDAEWETYSYAIVHLGAQLSNVDLFRGALVQIKFLRRVLCEQIGNASFHEPPTFTGLKRSDVAICIFNALTPLIAYATMVEQPTRNDSDELVRSFLQGIGGQWEGTSRGCIHSLSICFLEIPASVARSYPTILDKLLKNVTQAHLAVHILEFLAELARLSEEHTHLRDDEVRNIFGICIRVLEIARDRKAAQAVAQPPRLGTPSNRHSGVSTKRIPPYRAAMLAETGMPHYEYALAYHTMITWFLSLKLETRANHVSWIIDRLVWKTPTGEEVIDEQSRVFIDMMQRTTYSDLGETMPSPDFAAEDQGTINTASWIVGLSIVTVETDGATGRSQITKRQASGTTHSIYQQLTADTPYHHVPISTYIQPERADGTGQVAMLPAHVLLQMVTTAVPTRLSNQPIPLPNDDFVKRALAAFDRIPTVDGYKIGVIYMSEGQEHEVPILSNTMGSPDFDDFLAGLGTQVSLEDATFNTQGLVYGQDGFYTYAWRDRVSEIVYHVPTLMPTDFEDDPNCVNKKRHIGNDFVKIIFNRSGKTFKFDTFPSQFNYVNIVITPVSRASKKEAEAVMESQHIYDQAGRPNRGDQMSVVIPTYPAPKYYKVHVLTAPGFPSISPASDPKIISAAQLASFVRLVALNACVFALAWQSRNSDNEYPSSWRARQQEIRQLRERVVQRAAAAAPEPVRGGPLYRDRGDNRKSLYPEDRSALTGQRRVVDYEAVGAAEEESLGDQFDFSNWTR